MFWIISPLWVNSSTLPLTKSSFTSKRNAYACAPGMSEFQCCLSCTHRCGRELLGLLQQQFPWRPVGGDTRRMMDPNDSLDNLCAVYERAIACIKWGVAIFDIPLRDACVLYSFSGNYFEIDITMSFLCKEPDRMALMRSLRCLAGKGALNSMGLRAWKTCGTEPLTNQTNAMKNALFLISNITRQVMPNELIQKVQKSLFCLPDGYMHCFLSDPTELCGNEAAVLVKDYFTHLQRYITEEWLPSGISKEAVCRNDARQKATKLPGDDKAKHTQGYPVVTALQTYHGQGLLKSFHNSIRAHRLCKKLTIDLGYRVLVHSLFVKDEPVRFNLFHFTYGLTIFRPFSMPCHTGDFAQITQDWKLWRNVCPAVRSQIYPITVLIEGCRLYDLFDSQFGHCQWEDMLMTIYARAAAITKSPNTGHWLPGGSNYLLLDGMYEYYGVQQWADYTRRPLALIRQSLDEITVKCGAGMTSALMKFYNKVEYYMFDSILHRKSLNS